MVPTAIMIMNIRTATVNATATTTTSIIIIIYVTPQHLQGAKTDKSRKGVRLALRGHAQVVWNAFRTFSVLENCSGRVAEGPTVGKLYKRKHSEFVLIATVAAVALNYSRSSPAYLYMWRKIKAGS